MLTSTGSVGPETRKGRTATVRPFTNLLTSNRDRNGISAFRRQCLAGLGVTGPRADVIAGMAWGLAERDA